MSNSFRPHGLQHTRPLCPSPSPRRCPSSCSRHRWCCPAISSSDALFSFCPQSFPKSGPFPMNHLFTSDDHWSFSFSISPSSEYQGWSPWRLTGLISLLSNRLSGIFSSTTVQRHQFFGILSSFRSSSKSCMRHWEDHGLDYTDLCLHSNVCFSTHCLVCHHSPARKQSSSDFMVAVTIRSDFGAQEQKMSLLLHFSLLFAMQSWSWLTWP